MDDINVYAKRASQSGMGGSGMDSSEFGGVVWQGAEPTYSLIRTAAIGKRPIAAIYHGRPRLLCPHKLGWSSDCRPQVLCYQYGGDSASGLQPSGAPDNWRCLAVDKLLDVAL